MFCPACGCPLETNSRFCAKCGSQSAGSPIPITTDNTMEMVLPLNVSGWAIAAGYLGLFAVLVLPAPFALGCGIMAIRDLKKHPTRRGRVRAWLGVVMGGLFTTFLIVGLSVSLVNALSNR